MLIAKIRAKISELIATSQDEITQASKEDARNHERFLISSREAAKITTSHNEELPLINLSYGGFATSNIQASAQPGSTFEDATLHFLDQAVATRIKRVYHGGLIAGYSFEHKDPKTLIFLREVLECLRYGTSLHDIKKEFLKDAYQSDRWRCLRGEGPTDIVMRVDEEGRATEFLCTVRSGETYSELRLNDQRFSTGETIDRTGVSSRVVSSDEINPVILRLVMQILLGVNDPKTCKALEPIVSFGLKHLKP